MALFLSERACARAPTEILNARREAFGRSIVEVVEPALGHAEPDDFGAGPKPELLGGARLVRLDRLHADAQPVGGFLIGQALGREAQHLGFALAEGLARDPRLAAELRLAGEGDLGY